MATQADWVTSHSGPVHRYVTCSETEMFSWWGLWWWQGRVYAAVRGRGHGYHTAHHA